MLTKTDLNQIGKVVEEKIEKELKPVKKDLQIIKSDLKKVKRTVDVMAKLLDKADVELHRRVRKIEDRLGLPQPQ